MMSFASPLILWTLALLPGLYFLLRIMPPPVRRVFFPPAELILKSDEAQTTPASMPLWLLLLRMALLATLIFAMAGPVWQRGQPQGRGALFVLIDDSWAAAPDWSQRMALAQEALDEAEAAGRVVALGFASQGERPIVPGPAAEALRRLDAAQPQPLLFAHEGLLKAARMAAMPMENAGQADILWLSDGLAQGGARDFALGLSALGALRIYVAQQPVYGIRAFKDSTISVVASGAGQRQMVQARDEQGRILALVPALFDGQSAEVKLDLPLELRNEVARFDLAGQAAAGAVFLTDSRHKRARIGLISQVSADLAQQDLLNPAYYLRKAVTPFADCVEPRADALQPIYDVLEKKPNVVALLDVADLTAAAQDMLADFMARGGVVLRFAGPHLAHKADALLPVRLRDGGRAMGGALSWDQPKGLAAFEAGSPFAGLAIPADVTVSSQVLAEPDAALEGKVWARLSDGTPLVTAEKRGKGRLILVHVSANASWSNLALSGLYVQMMQRIVLLAPHLSEQGANVLAHAPPLKILDGFGALVPPPPQVEPLEQGLESRADARHPPGLYGDAQAMIALNALQDADRLEPLDLSGVAYHVAGMAAERVDLRPILLWLAVLLFGFDTLFSQIWRGGVAPGQTRSGKSGSGIAVLLIAALGLLLAELAGEQKALAQSAPQPRAVAKTTPAEAGGGRKELSARDLESSLSVRLAYVISGDADVDSISQAGLESLSRALALRTSVVPGDPVGLDPDKDLLDLYPLIYWPISAKAPLPSPQAVARLGAFMAHGGTVLIDTRDALVARPDGSSAEQAWLQKAVQGLAVPPLEVVPRDHVITKTYYLLDGFYGRSMSGATYVEALPSADDDLRPARAGDSVSPIIITSNDLAAGWASDAAGRAALPLTPGGPKQHELALRGGINLVMYTLTGNYKADQVHVPALLDRLRQQ